MAHRRHLGRLLLNEAMYLRGIASRGLSSRQCHGLVNYHGTQAARYAMLAADDTLLSFPASVARPAPQARMLYDDTAEWLSVWVAICTTIEDRYATHMPDDYEEVIDELRSEDFYFGTPSKYNWRARAASYAVVCDLLALEIARSFSLGSLSATPVHSPPQELQRR